MNNDEVELIYNYLHENYEYRDGELISIKSRYGRKTGSRLGAVSYGNESTQPCIKGIISINKKKFASTLAQFVFIYHHKKYTPYFQYIDGNKMNTKIENIHPANIKNVYLQKYKDAIGYKAIKTNLGIKYRVTITSDYKSYYLGRYDYEIQAYNVYIYCKNLFIEGIFGAEEIKEKLMKKFDYCIFKKKSNKFGYPGLLKSYGKYFYRLRVAGQVIKSQLYINPEEAHAAYLKAKEKYATAIKNLGDR